MAALAKPRSLLAVVTGCLALGSLLAPAPVWGDSIAFIRAGNLWIARPDGSSATQVTTDGVAGSANDYTDVTAAKGSGAPKLGFDQSGKMGSVNPDGSGKLVAPAFYGRSPTSGLSIDPSGERLMFAAGDIFSASPAIVTIASGDYKGFGHSTAVRDAVFAGSAAESLLSDGAPPCGSDDNVVLVRETIDSPSAGPALCRPGLDLLSPTVSPDALEAVVVAGATPGDGTNVRLLRLPLDGSATGTYLTPVGMRVFLPDWSPDGARVAFEGEGKTVWTVPADGSAPPNKILDDAGRPAWSPYSLPGAAGPTPPPAGPGPAVLRIDLTGPRRIAPGKAARGISVAGTVSAASTVEVSLVPDRRTARKLGLRAGAPAGRARRVAGPGSFKLKVRLSRRAARKLARLGRGRLTAKGQATVASGGRATDALKITLSR